MAMHQFTDPKIYHNSGSRFVWSDHIGEAPGQNWQSGAILPDPSKLPELLLRF